MWGALSDQFISCFITVSSYVSCTHTSWSLLRSTSFIMDLWQLQTNFEFIWKLTRALMAA
jgi:hypothetical protein